MRIDASGVRTAASSMAVDCARAWLVLGSPELQFAQLDPLDASVARRVVRVRYELQRFRERPVENEDFRVKLEEHIAKVGPRGTVGDFCQQFAKIDVVESSTLIDADHDLTSFAGLRAAIIVLVAEPSDMRNAIQGTIDTIQMDAAMQLTMPVRVLADALHSWKGVVESE